MKKTLIIGASTNPARYSYKTAHSLKAAGHEIVNIGLKKGSVAGTEIEKMDKAYSDIDTITLYVGPQNQSEYYDYIINTKPNRLIFNPGTYNVELEQRAKEQGIEILQACTLVLLSTNQY